MSSIPNSAMPHAGPAAEEEKGGETLNIARRAAEFVRDNKKTAIAAGAAVAVGAAGVATAVALNSRRKSANGNGAAKPNTAPKAPARKRAPAKRPAAKQS